MSVTKDTGSTREREGFLESEDDLEVVKLPSSVMIRTFQNGLWSRINDECGTKIDEYEGIWLEPLNLLKAATVIRESLNEDRSSPDDYVENISGAAEMLERCAGRGVRVMFSL